ncbi:putative Myb-like DNA-binding protein [Rhypophila decipiens]|uniref:Myb-like DNA-binding protein n=1 Tax=Rhypophila decipiens TaxID=261697 RepID=A0AAN7BD71_9PEZI|nr:putative Myb-like DNA-binding protein [Rhypophila decipiens]
MSNFSHQNNHRRGPWSQAEDNLLIQLVQNQGPLNWVRISGALQSRTPKQCRERYHQNLKPTLNHEPITQEEGLLIERYVQELGKRWAEIARRLDGRSDNAVKNWWNGSQNRRKRHDKRRNPQLPYDDRPEHHPSYDRNGMAMQRALPMPPSRPHPAPLQLSGYHDPRYAMESPLTSPSTYTPDSELAPSLMSDAGSHYSPSPRSFRPAELVELPPIKIPTERPHALYSPRTSAVSPGEASLPPISSMVSGVMDSPNSYTTSPEYPRGAEPTYRLPPMCHQSNYFDSKPQHPSHPAQLLTAPNSPVNMARGVPGRNGHCYEERPTPRVSLSHICQ